MQWVFCTDGGNRHRIGVYHGDNSGHVLVYCNTRIVAIDFCVWTDKTYSFFIDDELCNVILEKKPDGYAYGFKIDKKAETPKNLARKKRDAQDATKLILSLGGFVVVVTLIVILLYSIG